MFARLKGAIDSQIAAEQAKVRVQRPSQAGTPRGLSRSSSRVRNGTPSKNEVEKDPAEFEDSDVATSSTVGTPARVGTPVQAEVVTSDPLGASGGGVDDGKDKEKDQSEKPADAAEKPAEKPVTTTAAPANKLSSLASNPDLPTEVRVKLRKLEKMEGKYAELLRSYKIVHARNALIEPFEKVLRENTPVESIADPKSLIDYINSFSLRSDMVKEELIRVSKEKDQYKASLQTSKDELAAWEKELAELRAKKATSAPKSDDIFDFDQEHQELGTRVEECD
ncbi:hypothetical protein FN846DRAFT_190331 [Sphaerosporella brunnea]|uniref:Uncharacterized protein n=1 Tax=Sphaerosporella brunnea TaxID=1250544 RepID=A0A5J5EPQ4_9PEZI|nr:hypothetical protein FN846DRAFT_190331 [Sphaerosporella brunnea]